jgi:hypothetical protein
MGEFNPAFDAKAKTELDRRSGLVDGKQRSMPNSWKYKKYAYINLELTGNSASNICVEKAGILKIGDTISGKLYTTDGKDGPKRPNITLQSVNIRNEGGSDYTNAYLYEIEASFKVWSKTQMDNVEKGFFRLGAEMKVSFGWKGSTNVGINTDSILASIYNFGFSMDNDGSYNCNVKAMSASGLFGQETIGAERTTESLGLSEVTTGKNKPFVNAIEAFILLGREAFHYKAGESKPGVTLADNECSFSFARNKYLFAALELEKPEGGLLSFDWLTGGNDTTILYVALGSVIKYLNESSIAAGGLFQININGETTDLNFAPDELDFRSLGSGNPYSTFIPTTSKSGRYKGTSDKSAGFDFTTPYGELKFNGQESRLKLDSEIANIFINTKVLAEAYSSLQGSASGKDGVKAPPKTLDFLTKLFSIIETDFGGVVRLQARPRVTELNETTTSNTELAIIDIVNRAMIRTKAKEEVSKPYIFSVLGENSITRNVSLQSDFDTDLLIRASQKSIKEGSSNMRVLSKLYSGCTTLTETAKVDPDANTKVTYKMIKKLKVDLGETGYTNEKAITLTSLIQKYVGQNSHNIKAGAYGEVPMMLKLGVTIDGISGVKYMSAIMIDRMPSAYTGKGIDFPIISIEHSFDGQGDWSTTYETVMRIK